MLEPRAWIQWTVFGNKLLAFKKPDASPHCYTGIDIKERLEPLYSAVEIRKWLMEEPSAAMIHRAVESYDSNDGSMVEYCRGLFAAKLEELK